MAAQLTAAPPTGPDPAMVRCRCCRARVSADMLQPDGTCLGCQVFGDGPRFEAVLTDDGLTVRDRHMDRVIAHKGPWGEAQAKYVEAQLNARDDRVRLYTWVAA